LLVAKLRSETDYKALPNVLYEASLNPRRSLYDLLAGRPSLQEIRITYRGLRRIEELRDLLRRDRILEEFGILLDLRYFNRDLEDALHLSSDIAVSVMRADMDGFKQTNDNFGHAAGDVVMKSYLAAVRDGIGQFVTAYRGRGDETASLIIGQGHKRAVEMAEDIRRRVQALQCEHDGKTLPSVTASIGVATTPPLARTSDIETVADQRQGKAKTSGKNCVVSE
jgi:diguanylate cyclase (GGDEF)-like protein